MKPLEALRILELAGSPAGAFAARLFSDCGADVTRRERPGKRSERAAFERALGRCDVVIESEAPGPLSPISDAIELRALIRVRISPFGSSGPYARFRSNEFTDDAISGHTLLSGEREREPLARPGRIAHHQAGAHAAIGALAALRVRERTGRGQIVEVSHFEGLVGMHQHTLAMWSHGRHVLEREGNRQPGFSHPVGIYPCRDGFVQLALPSQPMRDAFLAAAGMPELVLDPRFADDLSIARNKAAFDAAIAPWLAARAAEEIVRIVQSAGGACGPVPPLLALLDDPQLRARGFWREDGRAPALHRPRSPFQLGERASAERSVSEPEAAPAALEPSAGPLAGLRVLDLSRVWAGPFASRLLGDLGSDVILVEAPQARGVGALPPELARLTHLYPDDEPGERPWNRNGGFNELARNRRGVTLDLGRAEAKLVFERLVRHADVVIENFAPGVMPRLGLGSERLREINPAIVHVAISGYGSTGPHSGRKAFGPTIEAGSGFSLSMGHADSGPIRSGVAWPDPVSGLVAVAGALVALHERDARPGRPGRHVDVSMLEASLYFTSDLLLEAQLSGASPARAGNRSPQRAPQGCYPCAGRDRWIAISVECDDEWAALCRCAGLGADLAALGLAERRDRHELIDSAISAWTRNSDPIALMNLLQGAGVTAAALADARDLARDPQLGARGFWVSLEHPETGRRCAPGCAIRLAETPASYRRPAPCLGQHDVEVMRELGELDQ